MCSTLVPLLGSLIGAGATLLSQPKPPKPPEIPAVAAAAPDDTSADVRQVGDEVINSTAPEFVGTAPRRTQARTLGGLGASGLAL